MLFLFAIIAKPVSLWLEIDAKLFVARQMLKCILELNFLPLGMTHLFRSHTVKISCFVFFLSELLWRWINVCPKDYCRAHLFTVFSIGLR